MSYILNLSLPLWWMFLPLTIATLCAYKYYQVRYILRSGLSNLKRDNSALQGKLEAALASEKSLRLSASQNLTQIKDALAKLHKLESEAAEREALIVELNKRMQDIQSVSDARADYYENKQEMHIRAGIEQDKEMQKLQSDLNAAIAIMNRTIRGRKQWGKYEAAKKAKLKGQVKTIIDDGRIEGVVYDALGVPHPTENQKAGIVPESVKFVTVYKADQSENDNGRHDVLSICNEVNRGIAEQAKAIKMEIAKTSIKFEPQAGELVKLVDYPNEVFVIENAKNGGFTVQNVTYKWHQWRKAQDMRPVIGQAYKNGYKKDSNTCYKEPNKTCIFDCDGLCKNA